MTTAIENKTITWKQLAAVVGIILTLLSTVGGGSWILASRLSNIDGRLLGLEQSSSRVEKTLALIAPPTLRERPTTIADKTDD